MEYTPDQVATLEDISDKIRMGQPVSIADAILAIEYQDHIRRPTVWYRIKAILGWS